MDVFKRLNHILNCNHNFYGFSFSYIICVYLLCILPGSCPLWVPTLRRLWWPVLYRALWLLCWLFWWVWGTWSRWCPSAHCWPTHWCQCACCFCDISPTETASPVSSPRRKRRSGRGRRKWWQLVRRTWTHLVEKSTLTTPVGPGTSPPKETTKLWLKSRTLEATSPIVLVTALEITALRWTTPIVSWSAFWGLIIPLYECVWACRTWAIGPLLQQDVLLLPVSSFSSSWPSFSGRLSSMASTRSPEELAGQYYLL